MDTKITYTCSEIVLDKSIVENEAVKKMYEAHQLEYLGSCFALEEVEKRVSARIAEWDKIEDEVLEKALNFIEKKDDVDISDDKDVQAAVSLYSVIESLKGDAVNKSDAVSYHTVKIKKLKSMLS